MVILWNYHWTNCPFWWELLANCSRYNVSAGVFITVSWNSRRNSEIISEIYVTTEYLHSPLISTTGVELGMNGVDETVGLNGRFVVVVVVGRGEVGGINVEETSSLMHLGNGLLHCPVERQVKIRAPSSL